MIPKITKEDFWFWRSPLICWTLGGFLVVVFLLGQAVTVKPYPNLERDLIIFSVVTGGCGLVFLWLGFRAWRARRK